MNPTWSDFVEAWPLFADPVICGVIAGAVLGWLGVHVVLRRMVFLTAALTQASGLGVALGFFAGIHLGVEVPPVLSAVGTALFAGAILSLDANKVRLSSESLLALVWLGCSAGAILVGDRITQEAHDIAAILFGTAVLVRPEDLHQVMGVGGLALAAAMIFQRPLIFAGFDRDGARVQGLPVVALELGLMAAITAMVAVSTRALGALPVFAFSVLPAMGALMATRRLERAFPLALVFGGAAGGLGYLVAFFFSFPVGACQAAMAGLIAALMVPLGLLRQG